MIALQQALNKYLLNKLMNQWVFPYGLGSGAQVKCQTFKCKGLCLKNILYQANKHNT